MSMLPNPVIFRRLYSQDDINNDDFTIEEKNKDAIYQVTYRKIYNYNLQSPSQQYNTINNNNSNSNNNNSTNNHVNNHNTTTTTAAAIGNNTTVTDGLVYTKIKLKQIKYGTVEKLIDSFTNDNGELDSNTTNTFLATYRTFTNIKNVLDMLFKKYEKIFPASLDMTEEIRIAHLKSFRSIITTWLDSYSEDFNEPPGYINLKYVEKFCKKHIGDSIELINFIQQKYEQFKNMNKKGVTDNNEERSLLSSNLKHSSSIYNSKSELNLSNISSNTTNNLSNASVGDVKIVNTKDKLRHHRSNSNVASIIGLDRFIDFKLINNNSHNIITSASNSSKTHPINLKTKFLEVEELYFAEQLTYIDKELFQKVIPYHCLGAVWSSRKKQQPQQQQQQQCNFYETITAFIEQFNIVTFIVQGTVLEKSNDLCIITPQQRARIIEKWIRIALHCRNYKNFSSLNAIVQGLDTQCVSRLKSTWNEVSTECKTQFNELIELFSQENNQQLFRETLMRDLQEYDRRFSNNSASNSSINSNSNERTSSNNYDKILEGTAKFADINIGINATLSRKAKEKLMKQRLNQSEPLGTVPFLGTFLRDLEYIHAQNPTKNEDGLVNFAKKRKEFEVIAQIKLLQRAAQFYRIESDLNFKNWLKCLPSYSEEENYELSYQIEPFIEREQSVNSTSNCSTNTNLSSNNNQNSTIKNNNNNNNKKLSLSQSSRCESNESISSSNNELILKQLHNQQHEYNMQHNNKHSRTSSNASNASNTHLNNSLGSNTSGASGYGSYAHHNGSPSINSGNSPAITVVNDNKLIVKCNVQPLTSVNEKTMPVQSSVFYKTIFVKDSDHTKEIKKLILDKFHMDVDKADKYFLIQVFPDGSNSDILIKDNCNVYYAVKAVNEIHFMLRPKELHPSNENSSNYTHQHSSETTTSSGGSRFTTNLFQNIISPKINKKKFQQQISTLNSHMNGGSGGSGGGVKASSSSNSSTNSSPNSNKKQNKANGNHLLPPQAPNHVSPSMNGQRRNTTATPTSSGWQMFRSTRDN